MKKLMVLYIEGDLVNMTFREWFMFHLFYPPYPIYMTFREWFFEDWGFGWFVAFGLLCCLFYLLFDVL